MTRIAVSLLVVDLIFSWLLLPRYVVRDQCSYHMLVILFLYCIVESDRLHSC